MSHAVRIIGIGNDYRSDDAAGLAATRALEASPLPDTLVIEQTGEGAALMDAWQGARAVILIDAVASGAAPGTIHRFDAHTTAIPARFFSYSSHVFSVAEAIELARALNQLPPRLIVYGIEGKSFLAGMALSPEVEHAMHVVVERVREEVHHLLSR